MTVPLIEVVTRGFANNKINFVVARTTLFCLMFLSKYFSYYEF